MRVVKLLVFNPFYLLFKIFLQILRDKGITFFGNTNMLKEYHFYPKD
jgi:hypothetical protein